MKVCARAIVQGMRIKGYGRVQSCNTRHLVNPGNNAWDGTVLVFMTDNGCLVRMPHELVKVLDDDEGFLGSH